MIWPMLAYSEMCAHLISYTPILKEELDERVVDERLVFVELGAACAAMKDVLIAIDEHFR